MIGFIAPNVHGYFFGSLLTGVLETAAAWGYRVVAVQTHDAGISVFEDDLFTSPVAWEYLDALIVAQAAVDGSYLREFASTGKPVVTIYESPEGFDCPTVVPDNQRGVQDALDHLIEHGHTDIAFVGRDPANADDWIRYGAYRETLLGRGLEPREPVLVPWKLDETYDGRAAVQKLRAGQSLPTAVMACTDITAMALAEALGEAGLAVPGDVAVVGFDDIVEAAEFQPPLSTVSQSFSLAGSVACTLVLHALQGEAIAPGLHCTPVTFVVRESCGCRGATGDVTVAPETEDACARFAAELGRVLSGDGEPTPARRQVLRAVGDRLAALCATVATAPAADVSGAIEAAAEALRQVVTGSANLLGTLGPVRELTRDVAARLGPGDVLLAARLERLALDVSTRLLQNHTCNHSSAVVNQHVEIQRRYYMISTDLVRRYHRDFRSLSWLEGTEVRTGCLALWEDGRKGPGDPVLRVVGTYSADGTGGRRDEPCEVRAFPPRSFVELLDGHPDDLVFVVPIRFDGSDWGFLALTGAFDVREDAGFERFNHWAVLLTVALEQERAIRSERALRGIRVSEERYALAAEAANDGLWDWNLTEGTVYYSARWKALLGYAEDEIAATSDEWLKRVHPDDRSAVERALSQHFDGRSPGTDLEYRLRTADGSYRWMLTHGRSVSDGNGRVARVVGSMTDITDRKRLEERLRYDAHYDGLTGLPNRALFLDRLNRAIARTRRNPRDAFAVVFLDLDSFKVVNDSLGHQVGDEVLVQVAKRLTAELRETDTVSRFGGDEFVLLLEGIRDVAELPGAVGRLLSALSVPLTLAERTRVISVAAGIAVSAEHYLTADEYIRDADTAMYRAKALGPGSVVLFDEAMHASAMARLHLEADLDQAITGEQFELYYQPILRLEDRRVVGLEALIRWHHPERGLVPPNAFLPVAETTGQARLIGKWTIREACRQIRAWLGDAPGRDDLSVSVNLSNCQFWDPDLWTTVHEALAEHRVPASMLVFEVTEGVIMHNEDAAARMMRQLRDSGIRLHVDDFGTGYSSLSALHTFPIDALKIDRSFVQRMRTDARSRELVRLVITMGSSFGVSVIAEGIEEEEDAAELLGLSCPLVQGYLFSRPLPASEMVRFLSPPSRG